MKESMLVSKLLSNSEVWYNITKDQYTKLERIDEMYLRRVLNVPISVPKESLHIETGCLPLKFMVKIRRLMYLWHILSREETELIRRVYTTQKMSNSGGDWVNILDSDKNELGISLTDQEIQGVSKNVFKNYVNSKVRINHLKSLNNRKKTHSKSQNLNCTQLKTAEYLKNPRFSSKQKRLLFKLRSKTLDVKQNFSGQHRNPWCTSCGLFPETQSHLLQCPQLVINLQYLSGKTAKLNENFIYGNMQQQEIIVNIFSDILEVRENLQQMT